MRTGTRSADVVGKADSATGPAGGSARQEEPWDVFVVCSSPTVVRSRSASRGLRTRSASSPSSVHPAADALSLHTRVTTDDACRSTAPGDPVAAYLDVDSLRRGRARDRMRLRAPRLRLPRRERRVRRAHARRAGLTFVGPSADVLALFGDKVRARELAAVARHPSGAGQLRCRASRPRTRPESPHRSAIP